MSDRYPSASALGETAKRFAVWGGLLSLGAALIAITAIGYGVAKNEAGKEQAGGALQQQHPLFPPGVSLKPEPRELSVISGGCA